jgi:predicted RNA-binding Zn-ribbon protein involved in translation (DUF1610 family)
MADLEGSGLGGLITRLDGKSYNVEDLASCSGCGEVFVSTGELNEHMECPECEEDADEADAEVRALSRDWREQRL